MSTLVTMKWRVTFSKSSIIGMETYYIEFGAEVTQITINGIEAVLKREGYSRVSSRLQITFPP